MDQADTFALTLPPLLHILFYACGTGVLAALLKGAVHKPYTVPQPLPALMRTTALIVLASALFSLITEGVNLYRMLIEAGLLIGIILSGFIHMRIIEGTPIPLTQCLRLQSRAVLVHLSYCLAVTVYFAFITSALGIILSKLNLIAPQEWLVIGFMGALYLFLMALFALFYKNMPLNPEREKHRIGDTLRVIVWPLMIALLMFILPLIMEKYVQSDEYIRAQNPPQRLHGI